MSTARILAETKAAEHAENPLRQIETLCLTLEENTDNKNIPLIKSDLLLLTNLLDQSIPELDDDKQATDKLIEKMDDLTVALGLWIKDPSIVPLTQKLNDQVYWLITAYRTEKTISELPLSVAIENHCEIMNLVMVDAELRFQYLETLIAKIDQALKNNHFVFEIQLWCRITNVILELEKYASPETQPLVQNLSNKINMLYQTKNKFKPEFEIIITPPENNADQPTPTTPVFLASPDDPPPLQLPPAIDKKNEVIKTWQEVQGVYSELSQPSHRLPLSIITLPGFEKFKEEPPATCIVFDIDETLFDHNKNEIINIEAIRNRLSDAKTKNIEVCVCTSRYFKNEYQATHSVYAIIKKIGVNYFDRIFFTNRYCKNFTLRYVTHSHGILPDRAVLVDNLLEQNVTPARQMGFFGIDATNLDYLDAIEDFINEGPEMRELTDCHSATERNKFDVEKPQLTRVRSG